MTIQNDPVAALVRFLKTDTDTTGMTSTRIYGGEVPIDENDNMPRPTIVIRPAGGGLLPISSSYVGVYDIRVDVYCYGTTPNQGFRLYRCVAGALKQMKRNQQGKTLLYWARTSSGAVPMVDKPTEWPFTYSSWQVLFAEKEPA